jgi:hypothetical protein
MLGSAPSARRLNGSNNSSEFRGPSSEASRAGKSELGTRNPLLVRETPVPGPVPRYEIPEWRVRYGVVGGITGQDADSTSGSGPRHR